MQTWKANLEETKQRYINWWNHKGIVLNMWEHFQEGVKPHGPYAGEAPIHLTEAARNDYGTGGYGLPGAPVAKDNNQRWFDPEWRAAYLDWYVGHSCLKADMLPVANTQLGPGSMAAILGGVFEGGDDTIWIHPNPQFNDKLTFNPEHPNYLLHKELLKACKRKAQGNYYVGMPDLMEGLDVLAALKGTDKVLLDTVMQPEVLEEQLQFINDVYFKVFDELYDIIREGDEMAFCYFSAWAPGKMTKLQSDISTMISDDDYHRFVQPYIRQQCQKIDYTLYHLDGVGAMHHLPSLLEIEELNAIQWTPGVGEPQGGSAKWYDLYKKIIAGGKSIMACWVTLDELRPLLDNVGGDGIHLEMDFHNEAEVEKAMQIVSDFESAHNTSATAPAIRKFLIHDALCDCPACRGNAFDPDRIVDTIINEVEAMDTAPSPSASEIASNINIGIIERPAITDLMKKRVLIFDGAMGTTIQKMGVTDSMGSNEHLCIERPEIISEIYRRFLAAGSDIITSNTFNAQSVSLKAVGLDDKVKEINTAAVTLARQMADMFTLTNPAKPRYVVGGIGPTRETLSISGAKITRTELYESYKEQVKALIEAGADGILFETIFDVENCTIGLDAAHAAMRSTGKDIPIILSFSVRTEDGMNMVGQNIIDYSSKLKDDGVVAVGVNCCPDVDVVVSVLKKLGTATDKFIIAFPNAGFPDEKGNYPVTPEMYQKLMWPMFDQHLVNIVGGCCGTTDRHIAALGTMVEPVEDCFISPHRPGVQTVVSVVSASEKEETPQEQPKTSGPSVFDGIVAGKTDITAESTKAAVAAGMKPQEIINEQMIKAMSEVGQRFQDGKAFVPQLLMAGRAMKAGLEVLKPLMAGEETQALGKVVIGTVKGDLHDIGKNLCASMLEGCGFEVINIGIDIDADTFVDAIKEHKPDILAMSALLTTTMTYMPVVIDAVKAAGLRDSVKIMVGGAPITDEFAKEIGADAYSDNANECVAVAKKLLNIND